METIRFGVEIVGWVFIAAVVGALLDVALLAIQDWRYARWANKSKLVKWPEEPKED